LCDDGPSALKALRAQLASLESAAAVAAERLSLVIESLPDGFVLYDGDDRLVICNSRYREIYALSAPAMVTGARFEDILRYGLARGLYAVIKGQEEAWLARRLADHRASPSSIEQQLSDGRWLLVIEHPAPDGGRVGGRIDITARKRQDRRLADIIAGTDVGTWEWNITTGEAIINER
jgi:PAS domain-containing protein